MTGYVHISRNSELLLSDEFLFARRIRKVIPMFLSSILLHFKFMHLYSWMYSISAIKHYIVLVVLVFFFFLDGLLLKWNQEDFEQDPNYYLLGHSS